MSAKARTREEIIEMLSQIYALLEKNPHPPGSQADRDENTFINALVWCAGGCVNAYHPQECGGTPELWYRCRQLS